MRAKVPDNAAELAEFRFDDFRFDNSARPQSWAFSCTAAVAGASTRARTGKKNVRESFAVCRKARFEDLRGKERSVSVNGDFSPIRYGSVGVVIAFSEAEEKIKNCGQRQATNDGHKTDGN